MNDMQDNQMYRDSNETFYSQSNSKPAKMMAGRVTQKGIRQIMTSQPGKRDTLKQQQQLVNSSFLHRHRRNMLLSEHSGSSQKYINNS
mmetsp:Transcript_11444/g.17239  ORF Transcript_11444/g.17239 Transcript_11444/m.17239 type:complete len:88 (+) Transcript_11444:110-373(+)